MNSRGCALVILFLILAVLAWGVLTAVPDSPIHIANVTWPSFNFIPTLFAVQTNIPTLISSFPSTFTPRPALTPISTPGKGPVRNGRLLVLGFDRAIWSADVTTGTAARLGVMMQTHIYSGTPWFSPNGRFALVARRENDHDVAYIVHADGTIPDLRLGALTAEFDFGGPRDFFGFAPDGRRFFFLDASTNPASLLIVNLDNFTNFTWPLQASPTEITFAAFLGDSDHLILKSYDSNLKAHFLEEFQVGSNLAAPRRLIARQGYQIIQFVVSPDATQVAIVFRPFGDDLHDELGILNLKTGSLTQVNAAKPGQILLTGPAWSPNSRYLLVNTWTGSGDDLVYSLNSFDTVTSVSVPLMGQINASDFGEPLSLVFSFAPDGLGAAVRMYGDVSGQVSSSIVLLDGSYHLEIARAYLENGVPVGAYVAGFTPDWTRSVVVEPQPGNKFGGLYLANLDGSHKELLDSRVPYEFFELGPVISPDGKWVACLHLEATNDQAALSVIKLDGSERRVLFSGSTSQGENHVPAGLPLVWLVAP
jgi:hypothetical protein